VDQTFKQGLISTTIISVVLITPAGVYLSRWIMVQMGATDEVLAHGVFYMQLLFGGMLFVVLSFIITAALQGAGDTLTPLVLLIFANALNIVVNYLFIFGVGPCPQMGVAGAAVGTLVSRFAAMVAGLIIVGSGRFAVVMDWRGSWAVRWDLWKKIFYLGLPASLQGITRNLAFMVMLKVLSLTACGMYAISGFTVAGQIRMVTAMVGLAMMAAATTAVGQNVGAGNYRRAAHSAWLCGGIAAAISTCAATIYAILGPQLIRLFNTDPEVVRIGAQALLILAVSEPFLTAGMSISGALRGAGDTYSPLWISVVCITFIGPVVAYILAVAVGMDTLGVWIGLDVGIITRLFVLIWKFRQGKWKELKVA